MKNLIYIASILLVIILLPSCGPELTGPTEVIKLEVLSVKLDKPQVHPGDTINAEVLVGAPENYNKEYHQVWLLCDPKSDGSSSMSFYACMNPSEANIVGFPKIDGDNFNFKVPEDTLSAYGLTNKYMYLLFILCESDLDSCTSAMTPEEGSSNPFSSGLLKLTLKRINVVSPETEITNHNPIIKNIYLNDVAITSDSISLSGSDNVFKVEIDNDSFDKKTDPDGNLIDETIATAWKSNSGKFDFYYSNQEKGEVLEDFDENSFSVPKDTSSNYKIYIIATDTRGGIDWKVINVTPSK
jgi:hypothetical protein